MLFFSILPATINEQYLLSRLGNVNRQGNAFLVGGVPAKVIKKIEV